MTRRLVVKLGTQVVVRRDGRLALERLQELVGQCAARVRVGGEVLLVSSGAVAVGRKPLGLAGPLTLVQKQACAAVGQTLLMDVYRDFFLEQGVAVAQVLLTGRDLAEEESLRNLQAAVEQLLSMKVIPVFNENDTVSTLELKMEAQTGAIGDNDMLSARVAVRLQADLLVLLTDVDGLYTDNPRRVPQAVLVPQIQRSEEVRSAVVDGVSESGRGGMESKLKAAWFAAARGVETVIASGFRENVLADLVEGREIPHTRVSPLVKTEA